MSRHMTLSHHMLRRTARKRRKRILATQVLAIQGARGAERDLFELGISTTSTVRVESTVRGPFGWRVVAM